MTPNGKIWKIYREKQLSAMYALFWNRIGHYGLFKYYLRKSNE